MGRVDSPSAGAGIPQAARHFGWLFAERIARGLIVFGTGLLVARHLGPASLGTLSVALALVTLLAGWVQFGVEGVVSRDVLLQPEQAAEQVASAAVLRLMVGVLSWFALLGVAWALPEDHGAEARLVLGLSPMVLLPSLLLPDVWPRAPLRGQWLVQQGHGGFYLVSTLSGAALNIGLNLVTIPRWGEVGAAGSARYSPRWICVEARDPGEIHRLLDPTHRLVETLTDLGTHRDLLYARR